MEAWWWIVIAFAFLILVAVIAIVLVVTLNGNGGTEIDIHFPTAGKMETPAEVPKKAPPSAHRSHCSSCSRRRR